jgi:hypothetical protein
MIAPVPAIRTPVSAPAGPPERLLRPAVRCPACSAPPRYRVTEGERDLRVEMRQAPETVLGTLQCHRRECATIYPLRAGHIQWAA